MKLIKCPKCGEMYSDSYKTCPFCQEDEALKGRSAAPHRKVTKHRRAPSILGPAMVLVVVLAAVLVGVLLFGGKGSANKPADKPPVEEPTVTESLSLNSSDFSLFKAGAAYQLKAKSKPEKGTYTWTSDNEVVATVSNKGLVTAVAPGTATITVTDSKTGLSASCIVRCKFEADKPASGGGSSIGVSSSSGSGSSSTPDSSSVDLSAFYSTVTTNHQFGMLTLADATMIKDVYPGLSDIKTNQCLPYINMMTMNSGEIALVEVADSGDVDTVKGIFQDRIDAQVSGGAWYPSAIEAWQNNSRVVSKGSYVMMVVHEDCDAIVNEFNALF